MEITGKHGSRLLCVKFCSNDKCDKSGENLSLFNFPSIDFLKSKWIAAIRRDEGPDIKVRVVS